MTAPADEVGWRGGGASRMTIVLFRELLTVSLIVAGGSVMLAQ